MKLANNTLKSICHYFKKELENIYDESELNQILQISFQHFFGWSRTELVFNQDDLISEENVEKIIELVTVLKTNKPLAQIIGEWEFYGLKFKVNEHTLIPRPETEELVHLIINENASKSGLDILDIGTGTGCIPITLKKELKESCVRAFDVSEEALKIAKNNSELNKLEVQFQQIDILHFEDSFLKQKYDVIVSNPPYIPEKEKQLMHKNVLDFEPDLALFVEDNDSLVFYDRISNFALTHLKVDGKLYFEINENYGEATKQLLIDKKFKNVNIVKDINEKDRIVCCTLN